MTHFHIGKSLSIEKVTKKSIENKPKKENENFLLAKSMNVGYYLLIPILLGIFVGATLDNVFKTGSRFALIFLFLGVIGTFYNLFKLAQDGERSSH